jgi:hypothetical protein
MKMEEKISFLISHLDTIAMLQGTEVVGIPVALLLGVMSWRSKVGKVSLLLTGSFLCVALYFYLFGSPWSFVMSSDSGHRH